MIEVEVKFELPAEAWPRLRDYFPTMQFVRRVHNSDRYYDTPGCDLLRQAVFVRVRNHERLEFKFNEQAAKAHLQSTERPFPLRASPEEAEAMHALFARFLPQWRVAESVEEAVRGNGLVELARIENDRTQYSYQDLIICVDQVKGLGQFVEIEMQCEEESDTRQAIAWLENLAAGLAARQVRVGYVELWLQRYHPQAYRLGKYQE
jgi:adenylate cyclase class 2